MVEIKSNRHLFMAGMTRSGKTVLIRQLLNKFPRVVVHDRKNEWAEWAQKNHYLTIHDVGTLQAAIQKGYKRMVYMPRDPSMEDFDEVCKIIFHTGNIYFCVDEAQSYSPYGRIPFYFGELMRLGAGRGIGVCSLVQRPRETGNVLISEASIVIVFRLQLDTDRTKISSFVGKQVFEPLNELPPWHFLLYDSVPRDIYWCAPVPMKG